MQIKNCLKYYILFCFFPSIIGTLEMWSAALFPAINSDLQQFMNL